MPERIKHAPLDGKTIRHSKAEIHLIKDQCKGCGYCIEFCPKKVFEESNEINARGVRPPKIIDESKCLLCSFCTAVCPDFAIYVIERKNEEESKI
jgi:2-oxoglutarate ferredoxin oxidoreductase subunit delta